MPYAGLLRRSMALLFDLAILSLVCAVFDAAGLPLGEMVEDGSTWASPEGFSISFSWDTGRFVFSPAGSVVALVLSWLYFAGLESSTKQATVGKRLLLLRVTDLEGQRVSLYRATLRYFGRFISLWILLVSYAMAGFTSRKQALHDMMAGTVILKPGSKPGTASA